MNIEDIAIKAGIILVGDNYITWNNQENIIVLLEQFKQELERVKNG